MEYTREQMMAMSPEERQALRRQLEAQVAQPQSVLPKPSPFAGLGKLIAGVGSAYTSGKVPMEMFDQKGNEYETVLQKLQLERAWKDANPTPEEQVARKKAEWILSRWN
jgi:hypothetical protein